MFRLAIFLTAIFGAVSASFARQSIEIETLGFLDPPLVANKAAQPYFRTGPIQSAEPLGYRFKIYRDGLLWDNDLIVSYESQSLTQVPFGQDWQVHMPEWYPDDLTTYFLKAQVIDATGNVLAEETSEKYKAANYSFMENWMAAAFNTFAVIDSEFSVSDLEQLRKVLKTNYLDGKKFLMFITADIDTTGGLLNLKGIPGSNIGLGLYIDMADYLEISEEGKAGWVSVWFDSRTFIGYSSPVSAEMGIMPVKTTRGGYLSDLRGEIKTWDLRGDGQLLWGRMGSSVFLDDVDVDLTSGTIGYSWGAGVRYTDSIEFEISKDQLNALLSKTLFGGADVILDAVRSGSNITAADPTIGLGRFLLELPRVIRQGGVRPMTNHDFGTNAPEPIVVADSLEVLLENNAVTAIQLEDSASLSFRASLLGNRAATKSPSPGDVHVAINPPGALSYNDGVIRWTEAAIDSAQIAFSYKTAATKLDVARPGFAPPSPPNVNGLNVPASAVGRSQSNLSLIVLDDQGNLSTAPWVRFDLYSGNQLLQGRFFERDLSTGEFFTTITWPNVNADATLEITVTPGEGEPLKISNNVRIEKQVFDYSPASAAIYPGRRVSVPQRQQLTFEVEGREGSRPLERTDWFINGQFVRSAAFSSRDVGAGVGKDRLTWEFSVLGQSSVIARVVDSIGQSSEKEWLVTTIQSISPIVSAVEPIETNGITVGVSQLIEFRASVADADDNAGKLHWELNGQVLEIDSTGGGNPSSIEAFDLRIPEVGNYTVKAFLTDEHGNYASQSWKVTVGTTTAGNEAPTCWIELDAELGPNPVLRAGYRYDYDYFAADVDGNLAYAELRLNGSFELNGSCNRNNCGVDDRVGISNGFYDRPSFRDIVFTSPGTNQLDLMVRDSDGAECYATELIDVREADAGSSTRPVIMRALPNSGSTIYTNEGDIELLVKDADADLVELQFFLNGAFVDRRGLDDDLFSYIEQDLGFIDGLPTVGNHTLTVRALDYAGNFSEDILFYLRLNANSGTAPRFMDSKPSFGGTYRPTPNGELDWRVCNTFTAFDPDGDLSHALFFSTAGPLDEIDGYENGQPYERVNWWLPLSWETVLPGNLVERRRYCTDVTRDGEISVVLVDSQGKRSPRMSWIYDFSGRDDPIGNSPPQLTWTGFSDGSAFNLPGGGSDIKIPFEAIDPDGDLALVEIYAGGRMVRSDRIDEDESYEPFGSARNGYDRVRWSYRREPWLPENWSNQRSGWVPMEFRVTDSKGNYDSITFEASWGVFNHPMKFPAEVVNIGTPEETPVPMRPDAYDEDGDLPVCSEKTPPALGTLDLVSYTYTPRKDATGQDVFVLDCSDGFGSEGEVSINVEISAENDAPVVIYEQDTSIEPNLEFVLPPHGVLDLEAALNASLRLSDVEEGESAILSENLVLVGGTDNLRSRMTNAMSRSGGRLMVDGVQAERESLSLVVRDSQDGQSNPISVAILRDTDSDSIPDEIDDDDDGDQLPDTWEIEYGLNPLDPSDAELDSDGDGISNREEFERDSDPSNPFFPIQYIVDITFSGSGKGDVVFDSGEVCNFDCVFRIVRGDIIQLSVTPHPSSEFIGWSRDCTGASTCVIEVNDDVRVDAKFESLPVIFQDSFSTTE